ncbi:MAG: serine/threonine protein kinase [Planctomycetes bacterium]|nr:serine/threonine protein kinase [Planctomycetota bacterium]
MQAERWARLRELLGAALELEPEGREAFVENLGALDRDLADELARWLELAPSAADFLHAPAAPLASWERPARLALGPDARVGRYRVCAVLGSGSSGVVLEAEQDSPRRRVALKILQRGLHSPAALQRFLDEARALALLDHPGVARVFEAGTFVQDGVTTPFIAMELVEGARDLVRFVRATGASRAQRLQLFLELCAAVGHGHARGVIHRDLKPANVLVDRTGVLKVIDFGIARCAADAAASARLTLQGDVLGTRPYMSPEQAAGAREAIDTRCDVYALGVLLHELLFDALPDGRRPREREARLPGDLEAVLLCALSETPEQRYASAHELAADVRRFREHRPIEARPPGFAHHARLIARRHRRAVLAWVGGLALLGASVLGFSWRTAVVEAREREKAQRVTAFLSSILDRARPSLSQRGDVLLRDVLVEAAQRVDDELGEARAERAELHATLGTAFRELGAFDAAVAELERALALKRADAQDDYELAAWLNELGDVLASAGRGAEAERALRESAAIEACHADTPRVFVGITANHLARALLLQGRLEEAAASASRAREIYATELGVTHEAVAAAERTLGDIARACEELQLAEQHYQSALDVHTETHGPDSLQVAEDRLRLGAVLLDSGRCAQGRDELVRARARMVELLPPAHPDLLRLAQLLDVP